LDGGLEAPPEPLPVLVGGGGAVVEVPDVELLKIQRVDEQFLLTPKIQYLFVE
jgi:hypothetical protein